MNLKKYRVATTQIFFTAGNHFFFLIYLMKPSFFLGCRPEKIQVEFYPIFSGWQGTHLFKTKNRFQIKGAIKVSKWIVSFLTGLARVASFYKKKTFSLITLKMFKHQNLVEKFLLTSLASLLLCSTAFYSVGNQFVADIIVRQK